MPRNPLSMTGIIYQKTSTFVVLRDLLKNFIESPIGLQISFLTKKSKKQEGTFRIIGGEVKDGGMNQNVHETIKDKKGHSEDEIVPPKKRCRITESITISI